MKERAHNSFASNERTEPQQDQKKKNPTLIIEMPAETRDMYVKDCKKAPDPNKCLVLNGINHVSTAEKTEAAPQIVPSSNLESVSGKNRGNSVDTDSVRKSPSNKTCEIYVSDEQLAESFSHYHLSEKQIKNLKAFLITVRFAEGTEGADGYHMKVGKKVQPDPFTTKKEKITVRGRTLFSSAAGAYQIMGYSVEFLKKNGVEVNVNPDVQDLAALRLLELQAGEKTFLDIANGNWKRNLPALNRIWAGIPMYENDSSGRYNQHPKKLKDLDAIFNANRK